MGERTRILLNLSHFSLAAGNKISFLYCKIFTISLYYITMQFSYGTVCLDEYYGTVYKLNFRVEVLHSTQVHRCERAANLPGDSAKSRQRRKVV